MNERRACGRLCRGDYNKLSVGRYGSATTFLVSFAAALWSFWHLRLWPVRLSPVISYYLVTNRTNLVLARWVGSHGVSVAPQATLGAAISLALAYISYELVGKRFLTLKRTAQNRTHRAGLAEDRRSAPGTAGSRTARSSPAFPAACGSRNGAA